MDNNFVISVLIVMFFFAIGFMAASLMIVAPNNEQAPLSLTGAMIQQLPCMDLTNYVETEITVDATNIYLRSGCYMLAMTTNELQTFSISNGMNGIRGPRPATHDVITDLMEIFEIEPLLVKIESMNQGTYFSKLAVTQGTKVLDMDIRPSDAIAIAVRTNIPVWVNKTLLEDNGEFVC